MWEIDWLPNLVKWRDVKIIIKIKCVCIVIFSTNYMTSWNKNGMNNACTLCHTLRSHRKTMPFKLLLPLFSRKETRIRLRGGNFKKDTTPYYDLCTRTKLIWFQSPFLVDHLQNNIYVFDSNKILSFTSKFVLFQSKKGKNV